MFDVPFQDVLPEFPPFSEWQVMDAAIEDVEATIKAHEERQAKEAGHGWLRARARSGDIRLNLWRITQLTDSDED